MTEQDVLDKATPLKNLIGQMQRLIMTIQNPTVEGVDISGSDFTTRYNALKADIATAQTEFETALDNYTP